MKGEATKPEMELAQIENAALNRICNGLLRTLDVPSRLQVARSAKEAKGGRHLELAAPDEVSARREEPPTRRMPRSSIHSLHVARALLLALALLLLARANHVPLAEGRPGALRRDALEPAHVALDPKQAVVLLVGRARVVRRRRGHGRRAAEPAREAREAAALVLVD